MEKQYIDIDGSWGIILCYGYDIENDAREMSAIMDSFGMSEWKADEALDVLSHANTGMTVSRTDITMSAVFISETDSVEQFFDTLAHELDHVQDAVCNYYDVPQGSEEAAWLQGYMMRKTMRLLRGWTEDAICQFD